MMNVSDLLWNPRSKRCSNRYPCKVNATSKNHCNSNFYIYIYLQNGIGNWIFNEEEIMRKCSSQIYINYRITLWINVISVYAVKRQHIQHTFSETCLYIISAFVEFFQYFQTCNKKIRYKIICQCNDIINGVINLCVVWSVVINLLMDTGRNFFEYLNI